MKSVRPSSLSITRVPATEQRTTANALGGTLPTAGSSSLALLSLACALTLTAIPLTAQAQGTSSQKAKSQHRQHATDTQLSHALPPLPERLAAANQRLHTNTSQLRGNAAVLSSGDPVPAFALYDQEAQPVLVPSQWQGKHIVVSFIFTRCQMANMCPAATAKMAGLQRSLDAKGLSDKVQLLSISFDPRYDSPQVLRQYAQTFGARTDNYAFLTGQEQTINDVLRRFGMLTQKEDGTINHSMATVLIDPDGNLSLRQVGPDWKAETFLDLIEAAERNHTVATAAAGDAVTPAIHVAKAPPCH